MPGKWGWEDVIEYVADHPEQTFTYGDLSEHFNGHRGAEPSIGSAMRAICRRGRHDICRRVVDDVTGKPRGGCSQ